VNSRAVCLMSACSSVRSKSTDGRLVKPSG
jgi:hypothetical protein